MESLAAGCCHVHPQLYNSSGCINCGHNSKCINYFFFIRCKHSQIKFNNVLAFVPSNFFCFCKLHSLVFLLVLWLLLFCFRRQTTPLPKFKVMKFLRLGSGLSLHSLFSPQEMSSISYILNIISNRQDL